MKGRQATHSFIVALAITEQVKEREQHDPEIDYKKHKVPRDSGHVTDQRVAGCLGRSYGQLRKLVLNSYPEAKQRSPYSGHQAGVERPGFRLPDIRRFRIV